MQTNWIGKSYGTEISFALDHPGIKEKEIRIFTTRPDTVYGVTFMALAPEHPLVEKLTSTDKKAEVDDLCEKDPPADGNRAPVIGKRKGRRFYRRILYQPAQRQKSAYLYR